MYRKRSRGYLLQLNAVHLGTNYLWISFESLILPIQLENVTGNDSTSLLLGIIAFIGISVGVVVSLFFGVLSDSRSILWGKRGPYIIIGSVAASISIAVDILLQNYIYGILLGYIFVQTGTNVSSAAYQPLFRDLVPEDQRGLASGINGIYTLLGNALGLGLSGYLMSLKMDTLALGIMGVTLLITSIITTHTIRHEDTPVHVPGTSLFGTFLEIFNPGGKSEGFFWLVGSAFLVFLGVTGLSFFELYYFEDVLKSANPAELVAVSGVFVLLFSAIGTAIFGFLSDRYGRWRMLLAAAVMGGTATALIPFFPKFDIFVILGIFIATAYGIYFSVSKALASDLSPREDAGKYMAYFNIGIGGSSAFSPLFYGIILDYFGTSYRTGFTYLFEIAASFYFFSLIFLALVPRK
ncbi:MAG: MFS transporter [Candidatus Thermoplasmatota archaeon]|nr:MFS transporter [Candidatus Thermoplasmatota archaeon]